VNIFLIRHAESEANAGLQTSDPAIITLTEKGKFDAIKLMGRISTQPEIIIVTPYLRTSQTAAPFISQYPLVPVETWPLHEFTYLSPSACKNTTTEDRRPLVKEYWDRCDPDFVHGPGAESFSEFAQRISTNFSNLKALNKKSVFVFTHGQVIRMIKQLSENGTSPMPQAMIYFRDRMLKFAVAK
jgi:broad specificity phosphatase PhoE